jgi:hypothetical protein
MSERLLVEQVRADELKPGDQAILAGPRRVHACEVEGVNKQWTYLRWEDEQSAFPGASKTVPSDSPVLRVVPEPDELIEIEPLDTADLILVRIWPDTDFMLTTEKAKALGGRLAAVAADLEAES